MIVNSKPVFANILRNSNVRENVYMSQPNVPIRYRIESDGSAASPSDLRTTSASILSGAGGGIPVASRATYIPRTSDPVFVPKGGAAFVPAISVRLKDEQLDVRARTAGEC